MVVKNDDLYCNCIVNIVICYANEDEVIQYAKQLEKQSVSGNVTLAVVINKENRGIEYLKSGLNSVHIQYEILCPDENLGYLNGLIYGFAKCSIKAKWYILSNTDIQIPDNRFLETFISKYSNDSQKWVVGPNVYAPIKKAYSNPYLIERPSRYYYLSKNIGMTFPVFYEYLFKLKSKFRKSEGLVLNSSTSVYAVHGSYMFIRDELLRIVSKREKWELLYDEEQYIAEIVSNHEKKVYYDEYLLVQHMEGTSTGKVNVSNRYKMMKKSNKRILKEFY